jgi:hypothetical protein
MMSSMSTAAIAIIAAAIGAGGAVAAQITTAMATARRERSRLEWEKERQDREWRIREEERFLAVKQELYTSYRVAADEFLTYINAVLGYDEVRGRPVPNVPDLEPFKRVKSNIELIAPEEVSRAANFCYIRIVNAIWTIDLSDRTTDMIKKDLDTAIAAWSEAYHAIRRDLHGEKKRFNLPAPKTVEKPPDIPPAHATRRWQREARKQNASE